jgi:4-amino-4-deoxy-L-arabinose transferase-like glycosyltransferase
MTGIAVARTSLPDRSDRGRSIAERILAFAESAHQRACALLLLLSLVCFLPGFVSLHPMDRDEPRFAQASKQMVESGDFIDIRFQDEARYKKPIGIHWMQSASLEIARAAGLPDAARTIAVYRVPSLIGALAAVLLTYWAALAFAGRREAFLVAAFMGSSVILMVEARLAKTDAMLLACSVAAMGALARGYLGRFEPRQSRSTIIVFWVAVAVGILIKGPLVLMFTGGTVAVLSARERSLTWFRAMKPGLGFLFVLAVVLPWFTAIAVKSGGEFYAKAVGDDMLGKVTTGQQQHFAPPGFYLVAFFATFWPGALFAAIAVPFAWTNRREDWVAFTLAWIIPSWLLFEAVPTKLPHYVMPLYPALALIAVIAIARGYVGPQRPGARIAFLAMPLIPVGIAAGLTYAAWNLDHAVPAAGLATMLVACAIAILAWLYFARGEVTRAAMTGVAASAVMSVGVFGLTQPVLQSLKLSPRLAASVAAAGCADPAVATLGYREPSLVFLVGTQLDMVETADEAAAFLKQPGCRIAFIDGRFAERFERARADAGLNLREVANVAGFNINGGRRASIDAVVPATQVPAVP